MKGIATLSVIPVRKEPSDRAEMVTQILFGEQFEVIERKDSWTSVRLNYDNYTGWIDSKQFTPLDDKEADALSQQPLTVALDLLQLAISGNEVIPVIIGSSLPFYKDNKFHIGQKEYSYEGVVQVGAVSNPISAIIQHAYLYLNAPYLWGGRIPFGIDCSGFTQIVFKLSGIKLKRDAYQQGEQGVAVKTLKEAKEGDLAFFKKNEDRITHTGIILSGNHIMHASGRVRIDKIDENGIVNMETNLHSHSLAVIRRII